MFHLYRRSHETKGSITIFLDDDYLRRWRLEERSKHVSRRERGGHAHTGGDSALVAWVAVEMKIRGVIICEDCCSRLRLTERCLVQKDISFTNI